MKNLITPEPELMAVVKNVPGYLGSSAELNFQAMVSNGVNELPVIGRGSTRRIFPA